MERLEAGQHDEHVNMYDSERGPTGELIIHR